MTNVRKDLPMIPGNHFFLLLAASMIVAANACASPLAADHPSIAADLKVWLTDAENDYDENTGTWRDHRRNGAVAAAANLSNVNAIPTLRLGATTADANTAAVYFSGAGEHILHTTDVNGGTGYSELTLIAV